MAWARGHIAVISSNYWPEPTGVSRTVTEFAEFLTRRNVHVRVATAMPYYPQWEIYPGYRRSLYRSEGRNGVTIFRAWHRVRPAPSAVGRALQEATLCLVGLPMMLRALWGARLAYVVVPALGYAFLGAFVARCLAIPVILVVKDVMPEAAVETGLLRNRAVIAVSRWLARRRSKRWVRGWLGGWLRRAAPRQRFESCRIRSTAGSWHRFRRSRTSFGGASCPPGDSRWCTPATWAASKISSCCFARRTGC